MSEYLHVANVDEAIETALRYIRTLHKTENAEEADTVVEELRDIFEDAEEHFLLWGHYPREES
jgi:DNA-directed RNA polymerase subunit F